MSINNQSSTLKSVSRTGPGEQGAAVHLEGDDKKQAQDDMKNWFMNVAARF